VPKNDDNHCVGTTTVAVVMRR